MVGLKEVEEAVVKVVEMRPDANYLVLIDRGVPEELGREIAKYVYRIGADGIVAYVYNKNDIRVIEISNAATQEASTIPTKE